MQLHFKIKQQTLMCYGWESPVAGRVGYLTCDFEFLDSDWDAVTTTYAVFTLPDAEPVMRYVVPFTDGKITEKDKVSLCEGLWDVNVIGTNSDGLRIPTDAAKVLVSPSFTLPLFPSVPQDVGETILSMSSEANATAKKAEEAAKAALEAAKQAGQNAPHIGENGNWWIGETDTGVPASGCGCSDDDIATDEDVDSMLGEIFTPTEPEPDPDPEPEQPGTDDEVATDDEVDNMLDEVFGEDSSDAVIDEDDIASDEEVNTMLNDIFS